MAALVAEKGVEVIGVEEKKAVAAAVVAKEAEDTTAEAAVPEAEAVQEVEAAVVWVVLEASLEERQVAAQELVVVSTGRMRAQSLQPWC